MDMTWLSEFNDTYLNKDSGKGIFMAGVLLGFVASCQRKKGGNINDSPLFKKMPFGKLRKRDVKRHIGELPTLLKAYNIPYQRQMTEISGKASEFILKDNQDLGIDGNFIFTNAFLNAWKYFYRFYPELQKSNETEEDAS